MTSFVSNERPQDGYYPELAQWLTREAAKPRATLLVLTPATQVCRNFALDTARQALGDTVERINADRRSLRTLNGTTIHVVSVVTDIDRLRGFSLDGVFWLDGCYDRAPDSLHALVRAGMALADRL